MKCMYQINKKLNISYSEHLMIHLIVAVNLSDYYMSLSFFLLYFSFQNLIVWSPAPVTIVSPWGSAVKYRTRFVWPTKDCCLTNVEESQIFV